jgi:hypothetical protein
MRGNPRIASSDRQSPTPFSSYVLEHSAIVLWLTLARRVLRTLRSNWHRIRTVNELTIASEVILRELEMAILKKTYNPIANPADEAPDCTGTVVMIDMKRCDVMMWLRSLSTHRTNTALIVEHCIVFWSPAARIPVITDCAAHVRVLWAHI